MGGRLSARIHVFDSIADANREMAVRLVEIASRALNDRGRFSLVLAGGGTPRKLYQLLAAEYRTVIDWPRVDFFWGDERYVPHDDPSSNYRMAREALLDHVPVAVDNVHPMQTDHPNPEDAAAAYEAELRSYFSNRNPRFDLILLGIGSDGHTASLFPGSPALDDHDRWVAPVTAPADPPNRLTLTLPILNNAGNVFMLAFGSSKAEAVGQALAVGLDGSERPDGPDGSDGSDGSEGPVGEGRNSYPAAMINPVGGDLDWWLDGASAAGIK